MGFFNRYPSTDMHELNLDWVIGEIKKVHKEWDVFSVVNSIRFYGEHDITRGYPAWSLVSHDNIGYISTQIVPAGVALDNSDYWKVVADYSALLADMQARITELEKAIGKGKAFITPEDYGALGGDNDDTEAVQNAINDGRSVIFTQSYKIKSIIIPFDTTRVISIDGNGHWLLYDGDGTDLACVVMRGISCNIKDLQIDNLTNKPLPAIYWTSESFTNFSAFNKIDGLRIHNFKKAIMYGSFNGLLDAPQSENVINTFFTRGVECVIHSNINNGVLLINNSVLSVAKHEAHYDFDNTNSCVIQCDSGVISIVNSEIIKPNIVEGYGLIGKNIDITECVIEIASKWGYCTGDIVINKNSGGYYSQTAVAPFTVSSEAVGRLVLDGFSINTPFTTDQKLVIADSANDNKYSIVLTNSKLNNRRYSPVEPISDYPIYITNTLFNNELIDTKVKRYGYNNVSLCTPFQCEVNISGTDITLASLGPYPSFTSQMLEVDTLFNALIYVKSLSGAWVCGLNEKHNDDSITYHRQNLHEGYNIISSLSRDIKSVEFMIQGSSSNDNLVFDVIEIIY